MKYVKLNCNSEIQLYTAKISKHQKANRISMDKNNVPQSLRLRGQIFHNLLQVK